MKHVRIYSTPYCPYCHKAKEFLRELNIDFTDTDVQADQETREELIEKTGHMTVPLIFIGDEFIGGYTDLAKLHARGELFKKIES